MQFEALHAHKLGQVRLPVERALKDAVKIAKWYAFIGRAGVCVGVFVCVCVSEYVFVCVCASPFVCCVCFVC